MVQALSQGGSTSLPWKRRLSQIGPNSYEYIDATCDEALLQLINPMLACDVNKQMKKRQQISQIDTDDTPGRRTFCQCRKTHQTVSRSHCRMIWY
jgi:hypothetical protein